MARRRRSRRAGGFRRSISRRYSGSTKVNFKSIAMGGGAMAIGEPVVDQLLDNTLGDSLIADVAKAGVGVWFAGSKTPAVKVAGVALGAIGARDAVRKILGGNLGGLNLGNLLGTSSTTTSSTSMTTDATQGGVYA